MTNTKSFAFWVFFASSLAAASTAHAGQHGGTIEQQAAARLWNQSHPVTPSVSAPSSGTILRPFSEVENTGFVAISGQDEFELADLRLAIAKNLPQNVNLIVYVDDSSMIDELKPLYSSYLGERLQFVVVPAGDDEVWGRDSLPFPVWEQPATPATGDEPIMSLVNSIYTQNFEPDAAFAQGFSAPMQATGVVFRGGNLLTDLAGNCFAVSAREVAAMSDPTAFFMTYFGCKTVTILPHEGGIGDIDERVKILSNTQVLTDNADYAKIFQSKGYQVSMIPTPSGEMETYMNTLLVNGTIFVPQMEEDSDAAAVKAYQDLGFNAVGVVTKQLADDGEGNIHCLTMNYPSGTFRPAQSTRPEIVRFSR